MPSNEKKWEEILKWCGITIIPHIGRYSIGFYSWVEYQKDGVRIHEPKLTLDNLFKYAVPHVITTDSYSLELIYTISHCEAHIRPHYTEDKHYSATSDKDKPEFAILNAIYKKKRE